ncbi:hypothetical protein [Cesiribacter andamanensis]|uniref:Uncharacterized protein n=1 Tax=Cesiribacter andamanensis AMV16 TaxID=1279009 RepID=M7NJR0_9BACT|nr:hypothetical protein [Cesiribacter andamanensis]EMR02035.1 hypothetical protein ADICEAN_02822 [Cesiribacter andamanensis AMV16]
MDTNKKQNAQSKQDHTKSENLQQNTSRTQDTSSGHSSSAVSASATSKADQDSESGTKTDSSTSATSATRSAPSSHRSGGTNPGQHTESTTGTIGSHPNSGSSDRLVSREDSSKGRGYDGDRSGQAGSGSYGGGGAAGQTPYSSAYSTIQVRQGQTYGSPTGNWNDSSRESDRQGSQENSYSGRDWTEGRSAGQGSLRDEGNDFNQRSPRQEDAFGRGQSDRAFSGQGSSGVNWDSRNYGRGESFAMGNNYGRSTSQPRQGSGGLWGENKGYAQQARENQQQSSANQQQQEHRHYNQPGSGRYTDEQNPYMRHDLHSQRQQQGAQGNPSAGRGMSQEEQNWANRNRYMQGEQRSSQAWGAYNMGGAYGDRGSQQQQQQGNQDFRGGDIPRAQGSWQGFENAATSSGGASGRAGGQQGRSDRWNQAGQGSGPDYRRDQ